MTIWLTSPYGPIPGEGWREYRFAILGRALADAGHNVIGWTPNFSHHFKTYRSRMIGPGDSDGLPVAGVSAFRPGVRLANEH